MKKNLIAFLIFFSLIGLKIPAHSETENFTEIDRYADNTPAKFTANVKTLTQYLIVPARTEKQKARVIFRWIAKNIRYHLAGYLREETRDNSAETVLKTRRGVCAGYAQLFAAMAKEAGLKVQIIIGDAKMPMNFKPNAPETEGHAWNAVEIEGKWHLLDATGGGGSHWNDKLKPFAEIITNHFFLIPPDKLIYSHFPKDDKWQLLNPKITKEQFLKLPNIFFGYWNHEIKLISPQQDIRETGSSIKIQFKAPDNLVMYGFLLKGNTVLNRNATINTQQIMKYTHVYFDKQGHDYTLHAVFPEKGLHYLVVVARKKNEPQTFMQPVILYKINAKSKGNNSFPLAVPQFYEENVVLVTPLSGDFSAGTRVKFTLKSHKAVEMAIYGTGLYTIFRRTGETFEAVARIPKGQFYIMAKFSGNGQYKPLLVFNGR